MKFYIIPLFLSICILFLVLKKYKTFQKYQRVSIFMVLAMGSIGFVCAVIMMFQKDIELVFPVFLFIALICQFSVSCFMNLQEKENIFTPKVAYAILMILWISLVVSFSLEALEIQLAFDTMK